VRDAHARIASLQNDRVTRVYTCLGDHLLADDVEVSMPTD
jgi:hypothetical protein